MHRALGAHDVRAVRSANALVAKAHAEQWRRGPETPYDIGRDARLGRRARPGRYDDVARRERLDLCQRELIVAVHDGLAAQFPYVPCEVVDERIIVVDQENHAGIGTLNASIRPRALSSVSRYSCSGSESATIPPPALKYTRPSRATAVRMAMLVSSGPV